jgi:hypothetical protein
MTQDKNHGSENLNWMEIAESDAINDVRHSGQRLPFIAAAVSLLIIGAGAVFAQTSNESPAQAEEISTTQSPVAISNPAVGGSALSPAGVPIIPNVAPGVGNYEDDDDDDEYEDDEYEDDDDHEDDDHDEHEEDD